jgi:DNA polymerase
VGRQSPAAADAQGRRGRRHPQPRAHAPRHAAAPGRPLTSGGADLAGALTALASTLRHHRGLGVTEVTLSGDYLLGPEDALAAQERALQGCRRCKLCEGRSTIVFGSGNPRADLVVIGEGPGADEDAQGKPFVGRAGQLLTKMLDAVQLTRDEVFITNAVLCRPPGNRNPEADELAACRPFLDAKLGAIQPKVVLALGSVATQTLLQTKEAIGKLRGRIHPFGTAILIPTFHPAFLLRNPGPEYRRMAWEDLKLARREYDARRTR